MSDSKPERNMGTATKGRKKSPEHKAAIGASLRARNVGLQPKLCPLCNETKARDMFGIRRNGMSRSRCRPCEAKEARDWGKKNLDKIAKRNRRTSLRRWYGISEKQYDEMLFAQNGACAICFVPADKVKRGRLFVDHCGKTGRIRGLLCTCCNTGIGFLQHDPSALLAAIEYLRDPPMKQELFANSQKRTKSTGDE